MFVAIVSPFLISTKNPSYSTVENGGKKLTSDQDLLERGPRVGEVPLLARFVQGGRDPALAPNGPGLLQVVDRRFGHLD